MLITEVSNLYPSSSGLASSLLMFQRLEWWSGFGYGKNDLLIFIFLCFYSFLGVLSCLDGYMNIALEQTEEYVNGVLTNSYGDAFVRGNNG